MTEISYTGSSGESQHVAVDAWYGLDRLWKVVPPIRTEQQQVDVNFSREKDDNKSRLTRNSTHLAPISRGPGSLPR
jgi:hypothetical protein